MNYFRSTPVLENINTVDLQIYDVGLEECRPGHFWGFGLRTCYLLHHVISGRGVFETGTASYSLEEGSCFLIFPDCPAKYTADAEDPWTYEWIEFSGTLARPLIERTGITPEKPVFDAYRSEMSKFGFLQLQRLMRAGGASKISIISCAYGILGGLAENTDDTGSGPERYVNNAVSYINSNLHLPLSVTDIAALVGINRKYFCGIFKQYTGETPMRYILRKKVKRSQKLLTETSASIGDIARSVGYDDIFSFSRMFTGIVGVSPSEYRKNAACGFVQ